jgi:hypothetical protein
MYSFYGHTIKAKREVQKNRQNPPLFSQEMIENNALSLEYILKQKKLKE